MTINIGLHGSSGRMGVAVTEAISRQNDKFSLVTKFTGAENIDQLLDFCLGADVIIDFSVADALENLLEAATKTNRKIVIGTTGLSNVHIQAIKKAAQSIAILYAPNTSIGANLVIEIAGKMSKILDGYDVEIIDIHHRYKKDAPSGTALAIGQNIAVNRKQKFEDVAVFDRANRGVRQKDDIGFSSLRSGDICGEHEVMFAGTGEVITIGSKAFTRDVFADGALFAAKWLHSTIAPGLYSMQDVLKI
jgi:4-hydroxy-tetrahydrodipicolinate reductase